MSSIYYTLLTNAGASAMAYAAAHGTPVDLAEIALGDGNGSLPAHTPASTALVNEVYRASINLITQDPSNSAWYIVECVVPPTAGNFWVREFRIDDASGNPIYIGVTAPEFKPILADGMTRDSIYRLIVETSNAATITLVVDGSVVMATHQYVLNEIALHEAKADPHPQYALKTGVQSQLYTSFLTTGTAPNFVGSVTPALAAYAAGHRFRVKFHDHINDAATLNINALGAKSIKQYDADGSKINAVIAANQLVDIKYDGLDFVLLNPTTLGRGVLSKNVAGSSDVTLTAVESANEVLQLTGVLTGSINVIVPTSPIRSWIFMNKTTGPYTLTVKTAAGIGVECLQGGNTQVFTDGINACVPSSAVTADIYFYSQF